MQAPVGCSPVSLRGDVDHRVDLVRERSQLRLGESPRGERHVARERCGSLVRAGETLYTIARARRSDTACDRNDAEVESGRGLEATEPELSGAAGEQELHLDTPTNA